MKIFDLQLRQPALSDLPLAGFILVFAAALVGLSMFALGWDIGQASAIIYGFTAAAIASACGVDFRAHGVRGLLVVVLIMVSLIASTMGLHLLIN
jgi:hypothetical protein